MGSLWTFLPLLAAAPEGGEDGGGRFGMTIVTFGAVFALFYFLILRPQSKKQKEAKKMLENIVKGDKVVTIGGIHGVVQNIEEKTVIIKVDDNTKLKFNKEAVGAVVEKSVENSK